MTSTISIIIPALNEAQHIRDTLLPLQPLRQRGHEVIVVDGGSSDETVALATPLADSVLDSAPGRAMQMATGIDASHQSIIWLLHADTVIPENADTAIMLALQKHGWGRFDIDLSGSHRLFRVIERMINLRSCLSGIATGDQGIFMRRELYERIGGMPRQPLMEDVELSRLLKHHTRPACLKQRLQTSSRRWEERGIVRTVLLMWFLRSAYALGVPAERLAAWYR